MFYQRKRGKSYNLFTTLSSFFLSGATRNRDNFTSGNGEIGVGNVL